MTAHSRSHKAVSHSHVASTTEAAAQPPATTVVTPPPQPVSLPPADANIPSPPTGAVYATGGEFISARPRKLELGLLPAALKNLTAFVEYDQVLGGTAPPHAEVMQALDAASRWSTMRTASSAWDTYCKQQEGLAWKALRAHMDRIRPAFALAATGNPRLATTHPGLASLLTARMTISHKGVATRRLNKVAVAEGKEPTHGSVGKKRKRAAEKALYASASTPPANAPAPPVAPVAKAAPAVVAPAPPAASPAQNGAGAGGTNGTAPIVNGAAHS